MAFETLKKENPINKLSFEKICTWKDMPFLNFCSQIIKFVSFNEKKDHFSFLTTSQFAQMFLQNYNRNQWHKFEENQK